MITDLKKELYKYLNERFIQYNHEVKNSIFLAGTGRSGTTWLSEVINYDNEYRYIFEPFHKKYVPECSSFRYRQYLRLDNQEKKFLDAARQVLEGRIRNKWTDKLNKKFWVRKRLIKDIRANLFLGWLKTHWPDLPIIFLLRHPCAVASSKIKLKWDTHLDEFLEQEELMQDYLVPFEHEMKAARTDFEKHIFLWCIETYVPLKQLGENGMHVIIYERFISNIEKEVGRLAEFLNKPIDINDMKKKINRPSAMSRKDSAINTGNDLLGSWRKYITSSQIKRAIEILGLFGLDALYNEEPMPLTEKPW